MCIWCILAKFNQNVSGSGKSWAGSRLIVNPTISYLQLRWQGTNCEAFPASLHVTHKKEHEKEEKMCTVHRNVLGKRARNAKGTPKRAQQRTTKNTKKWISKNMVLVQDAKSKGTVCGVVLYTSIYAMYTTTSKTAYKYTSTQVDKYTSIQIEVVTWTYVLLKGCIWARYMVPVISKLFPMTLVSKEHVSSCNKEKASAGSQNVIKLGSEVTFHQVLQSERFTQLASNLQELWAPLWFDTNDIFLKLPSLKTNTKTHLKLGQKETSSYSKPSIFHLGKLAVSFRDLTSPGPPAAESWGFSEGFFLSQEWIPRI